MKGCLVLEDGTVYKGKGIGASGKRLGEVVFNTSMTGYQEVFTDPSYYGQIVNMTYPLIGNYGINPQDSQSNGPKLWGLVVKDACDMPSNWRSGQGLDEYLKENNIVAIEGVDTRALTRKIRKSGTMKGIIAAGDWDTTALVKEAAEYEIPGSSFVPAVTVPGPVIRENTGPTVVLMDFGVKKGIVEAIWFLGCKVIVLPCTSSAVEILSYEPDGVVLSNGPGDPQDVMYAVDTIRELLGKLPIFGVCLGHQLLALALGGETFKLPFGHRGSNHPVKDVQNGRVYITSQNHGYAVKPESFGKEIMITHFNLNDGTVEGLKHTTLPISSVQYHPEWSPGPADSFYLFQEFLDTISVK